MDTDKELATISLTITEVDYAELQRLADQDDSGIINHILTLVDESI